MQYVHVSLISTLMSQGTPSHDPASIWFRSCSLIHWFSIWYHQYWLSICYRTTRGKHLGFKEERQNPRPSRTFLWRKEGDKHTNRQNTGHIGWCWHRREGKARKEVLLRKGGAIENQEAWDASGESNICAETWGLTEQPGGYLREGNPSGRNSRCTCLEWGACLPPDHPSLCPLDGERKKSELILQNHSDFSTHEYVSHVHTGFHKYM